MTLNNKTLKICVSSAGETLDSEVDPRFGRCKNFIVIDTEAGRILNVKPVKNIGAGQDRGAGLSAAEQIGELGVKTLITGDVGPKAADVLAQLGIEVYKKTGAASAAVSEYLNKTPVEVDAGTLDSETAIKKDNEAGKKQRMFMPLMDDNGEDSEVSLHFGHAPYFGIYDLVAKELIIKENKLDHSDPSKSPVDQVIASVDPTIVFAQDMGMRAVNLFKEKNVEIKTGQYKTVKEVIDNIDKLVDLTKSCEH